MNDNELMSLLDRRIFLIERIIGITHGGADDNLLTYSSLEACRSLADAIRDLRLAIQRCDEILAVTSQVDCDSIKDTCDKQAGCRQVLEQPARRFALLLAQWLACFGAPVDADNMRTGKPASFKIAFEIGEQYVRVCVHIEQHEMTLCERRP